MIHFKVFARRVSHCYF